MKKMRLDLDTLAVESFSPSHDEAQHRGTVRGQAAQASINPKGTCGCYTVSDYSVAVGCTDQVGCTNFLGCTGISVCYWTP